MTKTNAVLLRDFLGLVGYGTAFTIGTQHGTGWVLLQIESGACYNSRGV